MNLSDMYLHVMFPWTCMIAFVTFELLDFFMNCFSVRFQMRSLFKRFWTFVTFKALFLMNSTMVLKVFGITKRFFTFVTLVWILFLFYVTCNMIRFSLRMCIVQIVLYLQRIWSFVVNDLHVIFQTSVILESLLTFFALKDISSVNMVLMIVKIVGCSKGFWTNVTLVLLLFRNFWIKTMNLLVMVILDFLSTKDLFTNKAIEQVTWLGQVSLYCIHICCVKITFGTTERNIYWFIHFASSHVTD